MMFEHGVEKLACFLRIAIGEKLHRTFEIGEQNGDLFALAFQCALRSENLLGDVLGNVE